MKRQSRFSRRTGNLAGLLDHASAYARVRNIDASVLLGMRLAPNMYSLRQQVGEANRHANLGCALLAGRPPLSFGEGEPDLPELKSRIAATVDFIHSLPRAEIDSAADKEVVFTFRSGAERKFSGRSLLLTFTSSAILFPRRNGLRHLAACRRRSRQEGFSRAIKAGLTTETRFRCRPCAPYFAAAARPAISCFRFSKRCRASLSRSSTNFIAASRSIGPLTTGLGFSPTVSST